MAVTLELYDGSTTIDLTGTTYSAMLDGVRGLGDDRAEWTATADEISGVVENPVDIEIDLIITGSSVSNLDSNLDSLRTMLETANYRASHDIDTPVTLITQLTTTTAQDKSYKVLRASLGFPRSVLNAVDVDQAYVIGCRLRLLVEPYGHEPVTNVSTATLENEVDSTNLCYLDLTTASGHGKTRAPANIIIADANNGGANAWTGDKTMWIAARSGEGYDDTLILYTPSAITEIEDPTTNDSAFNSGTTGGLSTNASKGDSAFADWNIGTGTEKAYSAWTNFAYFNYQITAANLPHGTFRVLARMALNKGGTDWDNLQFGLGWVFGGTSKTPSSAATSDTSEDTGDYRADPDVGADTWFTLDLGEIVIPPVGQTETGTNPTLNLRVYIAKFLDSASLNTDLDWNVNYIFLFPVGQDSVIVGDVGTDDRIFIAGRDDRPATYLTNSSDVIQSYANATGSAAFHVGVGNTRLYVLRDDVGDPTTTQFDVDVSYEDRYKGV